jgi:L-alanine-DL-glutamate epimerase-like enolase superfamily enzyme
MQNPANELRRILLPETVWKVGGGFLIACVSCFKRARWDIFALFWLLAILQIEAYWDFLDSL